MLNQVEFDGFLTRAWEYKEQRYMRLANHRHGEDGRIVSSYVTVQVDASLEFNPLHIKIGQVLRVTGRIIGRDIVEPLRLVVNKSHTGVELPSELSTLVVKRPTAHILATQVKILWKEKRAAPKQKPVVVTADRIEPGADLAELIPAST